MHHKHFLQQLDEAKLLAAIRDAEQKTSGQIRIFISHHKIADPLPAAQRQFRRLGMAKTAHRNAILIFVAPKSHTFALYGDVAVHQKCGPDFWNALRDEMISALKSGQFTLGLLQTIQKAGEKLAEHFPKNPADKNDLPNTIAED